MSPETIADLDRINSGIEVAIMIPFAFGCRTLYRAKDSRAINLVEQFQYMTYCLYSSVFFMLIEKWWSAASLLGWVCAYVVKILMIRRYRPKRGSVPIFDAARKSA